MTCSFFQVNSNFLHSQLSPQLSFTLARFSVHAMMHREKSVSSVSVVRKSRFHSKLINGLHMLRTFLLFSGGNTLPTAHIRVNNYRVRQETVTVPKRSGVGLQPFDNQNPVLPETFSVSPPEGLFSPPESRAGQISSLHFSAF